MLPFPKVALALAATSKTAGSTATGYVDRLGFDHVVLAIHCGTADSTTNKLSVLKLTESDTTDATNFGNVSGGVGGTDFTIGTPATSGDSIYLFSVDCRARKRYIGFAASPPTTEIITGFAMMFRAKEAPRSAAEAGAKNLVEL